MITFEAVAGSTSSCAGVHSCQPHDLRHEALSRLADDGIPAHESQFLAGHSSITTTQRYTTRVRARWPSRCIRHANDASVVSNTLMKRPLRLAEGMRDAGLARYQLSADARSAFARFTNV